MRKPLVIAMAVLCMAAKQSSATVFYGPSDSVKIVHVLDGVINEWKADRFETDKETQVLYAVDHDAENIYLALKVPGMRTQMKMMMMGMNLYLDKKGKKREGTGIEFPVKRESSDGSGFGGRGGARGGEAPDPKAMREKMAASMIFLKTFGFDDQEDKTMMIAQQNGINIAFTWDDANVLYVEYQVPISFLGKSTDLKGKPLGIGWKINGMSQPANANGATEIAGGMRGGGRTSMGGGRPGGGTGASGSSESAESKDMAKEQSFWTKYNLN